MRVLAIEWTTLLLHGDQSQYLFCNALSASEDSYYEHHCLAFKFDKNQRQKLAKELTDSMVHSTVENIAPTIAKFFP